MIRGMLRKYANVELERRITKLERRMGRTADEVNNLHAAYVTLLELGRKDS